MPVHVHADEEELFYVLDGEGLSWQDGRAYPVRAGDCILHRPGAEAHTILGAGDGLDVLAFSGGSDTGLTWLPRARAWWNGPHWLPHDGPNPFEAEEAAGPLDVPEPETERPPTHRRARRRPGRGLHRAGATWWPCAATSATCSGRRAPASATSWWRRARSAARRTATRPRRRSSSCSTATGRCCSATRSTRCARAASSPARPAPACAHAFRAGDAPLTLLAFGTREPNDIVFFPRSGKVGLRGIRARFLIQQVEYWDGEA